MVNISFICSQSRRGTDAIEIVTAYKPISRKLHDDVPAWLRAFGLHESLVHSKLYLEQIIGWNVALGWFVRSALMGGVMRSKSFTLIPSRSNTSAQFHNFVLIVRTRRKLYFFFIFYFHQRPAIIFEWRKFKCYFKKRRRNDDIFLAWRRFLLVDVQIGLLLP